MSKQKDWQDWATIEMECGAIARIWTFPSLDELNPYMLICKSKNGRFLSATLEDEEGETIANFIPTGSASVKDLLSGKRCRRSNLKKLAFSMICN